MKRTILAALVGSTALIPAAFAQTTLTEDQLMAAGNDCERLGLVARAESALDGFDYDGINTRIAAADDVECRVGLQQFADADVDVARTYLMTAEAAPLADAETVAVAEAEITVAVPQPQISVTQAQPQVSLRQAAADVNVEQPEPIITVQIPEPTVTVEQPRPEIIVRIPQPEVIVNMPEPIVGVAQAEPIITVEMPEPIVTVNIPQPEVSVAMAQPEVSVDQAQPTVAVEDTAAAAVQVAGSNAAAVTIEQAEPVVTIARAEPRIDLQRGEATVSIVESEAAAVTVEGAGEIVAQEAGMVADAEVAAVETPAVGVEATETEVAAVAVAEDVETTASVADATVVGVETQAVTVQDILDMDLIGAAGEEIGDVERVISQNGELFVVVGNGGFLGLGEKQVALPLADMTMRDGDLYTRAYTEDEVEEMAEFDMTNITELPVDQTAEIGLFQ